MKQSGLSRAALGAAAVLALFFTSACADRHESVVQQRINVTGQGSASIAPDMAVVTLTVSRQAETARAALDANSAAMEQVLDAMRSLEVAKRDLQTTDFSIAPRYSYPARDGKGGRKEPRLIGYTVRNTLTVRVRDIERVGEVLDKSVTLGVNEGGSILFANDDASKVMTKARKAAVADAMGKARTLARGAGVKLGDVLEISEHSINPMPRPMAKMARGVAAAEAVPVASGENSYGVTVNLSLAIDQ